MKRIFESLLIFFAYQVTSLILYFIGDYIFSEYLGMKYYFLLKPIIYLIIFLLLITVLRRRKFFHEKGIAIKSKGYLIYPLMLSVGVFLYFLRMPLFHLENWLLNQPIFQASSNNDLPHIYFIVNGFSRIFLVPILEELLFRTIILGNLINKGISPSTSILVSSSLFALLHLDFISPVLSYKAVIGAFIVGIITGLVYVRSRNVKYTIAIHAAGNLSAFLITAVFPKEYSSWLIRENFGFVYWIIVSVSILALILCLKRAWLYIRKNNPKNSEVVLNW